jgi:hypothetical protein
MSQDRRRRRRRRRGRRRRRRRNRESTMGVRLQAHVIFFSLTVRGPYFLKVAICVVVWEAINKNTATSSPTRSQSAAFTKLFTMRPKKEVSRK